MDEVYRGYRIAIRLQGEWSARVSHVRGSLVPLTARASPADGPHVCLERARALVDRYIEFLAQNEIDGEPN